MPFPAAREVTPEFVKLHVVPEYEQAMPDEQELVVVAAPAHAPLLKASTWPGVAEKRLVVEMAVGAAEPPVRLPTMVFAAWFAS
jgi:hypothetical protein